jgi:hypothetical protein
MRSSYHLRLRRFFSAATHAAETDLLSAPTVSLRAHRAVEVRMPRNWARAVWRHGSMVAWGPWIRVGHDLAFDLAFLSRLRSTESVLSMFGGVSSRGMS